MLSEEAAMQAPPRDVERKSELDDERGRQLGRYVILERLGAGGMGVVYAAYDPELDRRVAVKILKPGRDEAQLLAEAQAQAKLSHPNVVPMHDVGTHEGRVFLAMEYIAGRTLRAWLAQERREWREVLPVLAYAGTGLAAAHAAGMVHRDFKPENVLVRDDGRVFVADFGLAAPESEQGTGSDALRGTPAYMSPEQHRAEVTDARSDQFAFAVTLYEALYGELPFAVQGDSLSTATAFAVEAISGRVAAAPRASDVPSWVRKAVVRALSPRPEDRYPSMEALLEALRRDPARRRMRWILAGAGAAALSAVALLMASLAPEVACTGGAARLAEVWNPAAAAGVRLAFARTGRRYAGDTADRVVARLDSYGARWTDQHHETCAATTLRGERSEGLLDLGMRCLERRRDELRAVLDLFTAKPDGEVVENAVRVVTGLANPKDCDDVEALASDAPPLDEATAARVATARGTLARVEVLMRAGKLKAALAPVRALVVEARAIGHARLLGEVLIADALVTRGGGELADVQPRLDEAMRVAAQAHDDLTLARAYRETAWGLDYLTSKKPEAALVVAQLAEAAAIRAGDQRLLAETIDAQASALDSLGQSTKAIATYQRALAIVERVEGPDSTAVARLLSNMGVLVSREGRVAESVKILERAVAINERENGPEHLSVAAALSNLGSVYLENLRPEQARDCCYLRALAIFGDALGEDDVRVSITRSNLALVASELGEWEESDRLFTRVISVRQKALGADAPSTLQAMSNQARVRVNWGRYQDALTVAREAMARMQAVDAKHPLLPYIMVPLAKAQFSVGQRHEGIATMSDVVTRLTAAPDPDQLDVINALNDLGELQVAAHELAAARASYTRSRALLQQVLGRDDLRNAVPLVGLARCDLVEGKVDDAIEHASRALELMAGAPATWRNAEAEIILAKALVQRDPARSLSLAERAAREPRIASVTREIAAFLSRCGARRCTPTAAAP